MELAAFFRIILALSFSCGFASAQEKFALQSLHCPKRPDNSISVATVAVRPWPISTMFHDIPASGANLASIISEPELLSLPVAVLYERMVGQPSTPLIEKAARQFQSGTTNAVLIERGNRILVFPRVLLLHPALQSLQIRNGDFIATVKGAHNGGDSEADRLRKYLLSYQEPTNEEPPKIYMSGPLLPVPSGFQQAKGKDVSPVIKDIEAAFTSLSNPRRVELPENSTPVSVLIRRIGATELIYVCPLQTYGIFRQDGALMQLLAAGTVASEEEKRLGKVSGVSPDSIRSANALWEFHCGDSARNGSLREGDTILLTQLELFVLTSGFTF